MDVSGPLPRRPAAGDPTPPGRGDSRHRWPARGRRRRTILITGSISILIIATSGLVISLSRSDGAQPTPGSAAGRESSPAPALSSSTPAGSGSGTPRPVSPSATRKTASATRSATDSARVGPPVGGGWPNVGNTGVPNGTRLTTYGGPCQITRANTVIDAKTVSCDLDIRAADVTIKRSKINGAVILDTDIPGSDKWSYTLADSEVNAGVRQYPAVSYGNMTVVRSNIYGGETSVQCGEKALTCTVQDSWLHGQRIPSTANWHLGGFLSNGGHTIRLRHNTVVCDAPVNSVGEGCTGDINLFGDFAVVSDVVVDSNFLGANTGSSYCLYGGSAGSKPYPDANHVVITNNVFQRGKNAKCGAYGPVSSFDVKGAGNVWANNRWDSGGTVPPAD
jgi:hypothetical protein